MRALLGVPHVGHRGSTGWKQAFPPEEGEEAGLGGKGSNELKCTAGFGFVKRVWWRESVCGPREIHKLELVFLLDWSFR